MTDTQLFSQGAGLTDRAMEIVKSVAASPEKRQAVIDWLVQSWAPLWMERAGHVAEASRLREFPTVSDLAMPVIQECWRVARDAPNKLMGPGMAAMGAMGAAWTGALGSVPLEKTLWDALYPTASEVDAEAQKLLDELKGLLR